MTVVQWASPPVGLRTKEIKMQSGSALSGYLAQSDSVFVSKADSTIIGANELTFLDTSAGISSLRRSRICMHTASDQKVHEMVIVLKKDSLIRPHRHWNKSESYHMIDGRMAVVFFHDDGRVAEVVRLGDLSSSRPFLYRSTSTSIHTVIPETETVVFHEVTSGPFNSEETEIPDWVPHGVNDLVSLIAKIRSAIEM